MITYTYDNCQISHFAVIQVDMDCKVENRPSVGLFCRGCQFFESIKAFRSKDDDVLRHYVFCSHPNNNDLGTATGEVRRWFVDKLEEEALIHFCD